MNVTSICPVGNLRWGRIQARCKRRKFPLRVKVIKLVDVAVGSIIEKSFPLDNKIEIPDNKVLKLSLLARWVAPSRVRGYPMDLIKHGGPDMTVLKYLPYLLGVPCTLSCLILTWLDQGAWVMPLWVRLMVVLLTLMVAIKVLGPCRVNTKVTNLSLALTLSIPCVLLIRVYVLISMLLAFIPTVYPLRKIINRPNRKHGPGTIHAQKPMLKTAKLLQKMS